MKLVIYDAAWERLAPAFASALGGDWRIEAGSNDPGWLARQLPDAEALLALRLPPEMRAVAQRLRLFLFPGAGVMQSDPRDLPDGCALCNVYEHEGPIAEYVLMVILMHVSRIQAISGSFKQGRWDGNGRMGGERHDEVAGKTIGLIGYGHIAHAVALRARAFGLKICALRREPGAPLPDGAPVPDQVFGWDEMGLFLAACDFVTVSCPLNEATRELIGDAALACMKRTAMLINVSRAEIVNELALYAALVNRRIAAAALDVWYRYPAGNDETMHGSSLPFHDLPNVILTPHYSAWTDAMLERRCLAMAANLRRLKQGEALERVVMEGSWKGASG